jgi:predicted RNase H-like HicB family nuclease
MMIQWSDEDQAFIVTLPEFQNAQTHGDTYEKAVKYGRELIESFVNWYREDGRELPVPLKYTAPMPA